jgi:hypothetical protein
LIPFQPNLERRSNQLSLVKWIEMQNLVYSLKKDECLCAKRVYLKMSREKNGFFKDELAISDDDNGIFYIEY